MGSDTSRCIWGNVPVWKAAHPGDIQFTVSCAPLHLPSKEGSAAKQRWSQGQPVACRFLARVGWMEKEGGNEP